MLCTIIVLGGYIFLAVFWWPVVQRTLTDVQLQVRLLGQTLRRFFTVAILAFMLQIMTGGLYMLPAAYRTFGAGAALDTFHRLLFIKLVMVFLVLFLVPMQLFGMTFRLTRMDAGIYPFDAQVVARIGRRMQIVSYCIIVLLTLVVLISTQL